MKDKTYRVEITRSQTLSILITDKSTMSAVARANMYAEANARAFSGIPFEITRRSSTVVHDDCERDIVNVDLTAEK